MPGIDPWSAVAAGVAAGPPMPWMQAAADYPGAPPGIYGVAPPGTPGAWDSWPSAQAQRPTSGPRGMSSMTTVVRAPAVLPIHEVPRGPALSNAFEVLAEDAPTCCGVRGSQQPTNLDAIHWRVSTTLRSRRDILRRRNVFVSIANHTHDGDTSNQLNSKMIDQINVRTSRHICCETISDDNFDWLLKKLLYLFYKI